MSRVKKTKFQIEFKMELTDSQVRRITASLDDNDLENSIPSRVLKAIQIFTNEISLKNNDTKEYHTHLKIENNINWITN